MPYYQASIADCEHFDREGYVLIPQLFDAREAEHLQATARGDHDLKARATTRSDAQGGATTLTLANELGNDLYGRIVRSRRVAENMAKFLRDEVYHYHHKMMLKEPLWVALGNGIRITDTGTTLDVCTRRWLVASLRSIAPREPTVVCKLSRGPINLAA